MSHPDSIPLEVIYTPVSSVPSYRDLSSETSSTISQKTEKTKKKKSATSFCGKCCICLWTCFIIVGLGMTLTALTVGYFNMKGCFQSEHYELTEMITSAEYVKEIQFEVVTGAVIVGSHDKDDIVVKLYKSARQEELLEDIDLSASVERGVLKIQSFSPSFDFNECQFSYIEILFPADITKQVSPIDVTGTVRAGFIELDFLMNLGNVKLNVELGAIDVDAINANTIEAQAGLGYIETTAMFALKHAKFAVETGSIRTHFVTAPEFEALVKYGSSMNIETYTDDATVYAKYGYATMLRPSHLSPDTDQEVSVEAFYGRAIASYEQFYNVEFKVSGEHGERAVIYEDECELGSENEDDDQLVGTCSIYTFEPVTKFSVTSTYGHSLFVQNAADEDSLDSYPESPRQPEIIPLEKVDEAH